MVPVNYLLMVAPLLFMSPPDTLQVLSGRIYGVREYRANDRVYVDPDLPEGKGSRAFRSGIVCLDVCRGADSLTVYMTVRRYENLRWRKHEKSFAVDDSITCTYWQNTSWIDSLRFHRHRPAQLRRNR